MNFFTKFCFLILISCYIIEASNINHYKSEFEQFKKKYSKNYSNEIEEKFRFELFSKKLAEINKFNEEQSHILGFTRGLNHLSDIHESELKLRKGFKRNISLSGIHNSDEAEEFFKEIMARDIEVPESLDWRKVSNRVSAVKNQGSCGSCWAFATTGLLEGQKLVQQVEMGNETLIELSEQEILDCSEHNDACGGGASSLALKDLAKIGGIESEKDYPYKARRETCKFSDKLVVKKSRFPYVVKDKSEETLKILLAKYGPVSIAIDAGFEFSDYKSGIYYSKKCGNKENDLDHEVLVVGYGTDKKTGRDYWIVKNSWSKWFGIKGYILMSRNRGNNCGIVTEPTIAATA